MRVKIININSKSYLGRDFRSKDSDLGLEGSVREIFVETTFDTFQIEKVDIKALDTLIGKDKYVIFYIVKMNDGRTLELVHEEIEIL